MNRKQSRQENTIKTGLMALATLVLVWMILFTGQGIRAQAADAEAVGVGLINYETLELQVLPNGNSVVFYSTDKATWNELEAKMDSSGTYQMDISWLKTTSDVTLYFKGDVVKTIVPCTIKKQNSTFKVVFNKADGSFTFSNQDEAESFQWRNASDYTWHTVSFEEDSAAYIAFLKTVDNYRVKATKLVFRTTPIFGAGANNTGARASKEVTISVAARSAAPNVKVNVKKLTLNTTAAMEYFDKDAAVWVECDKTMSLLDLLPGVFTDNGAKDATLQIRTAETETRPYSKTCTLIVPGQGAAPTVGDSSKDVTYYYASKKLVLQFTKANAGNVYEYSIVKPGYEFDINKASWSTVKKDSAIKISTSRAPSGSTVYVRKAGTAENISKNIPLTLPSDYSTIKVD